MTADPRTREPLKARLYVAADRDALVALFARVFPDDPPRNEPNAFVDRKAAMGDGLL